MLPTKSQLFGKLPAFLQIPIRYWFGFFSRRLEPELFILKDLLTPRDLALDIGANHGVYTYKLRRLGLRVLAFEPNSQCSDVLSRWSVTDPNATVFTTALGDFTGTVELQIPVDSQGREHVSSSSIRPHPFHRFRSLNVPITTLDSFNLSNVGFIKIDVEGAEMSVVHGAICTIRTSHPALLIEIEKRHCADSFSAIFNMLQDEGYHCFFLHQNSLLPYDQFDVTTHQRVENLGVACRTYINNFLFLHNSRLKSYTYANFLKCWSTL